jgi:hypothetical protein
MKYLCLICAEKVMEQMSIEAAEQHFQEYTKFTDDIKASGHFISCNRLLPPNAAITLRVRNDKMSTTDGSYIRNQRTTRWLLSD